MDSKGTSISGDLFGCLFVTYLSMIERTPQANLHHLASRLWDIIFFSVFNHPNLPQDGCTANLILANAEKMISINLGDSMAYLCRMKDSDDQDDTLTIPLQQRQHKCWMMKEKDRILRSGGAVENGRINGILEVSRAFGDLTLKKFGVLCTPEYMKFQMDREKDNSDSQPHVFL